MARGWLRKQALKLAVRLVAAAARGVGRLERWSGLQLLAAYPRSRYGVRLKANWADRTFQYCLFGTYGDGLSNVLRNAGSPFLFVDVGANQGLFSLIAAANPRCRGAIALEPVRETFTLLEYNVMNNGATGIVRPVRAALSDRNGTSAISLTPGHSGVASLRGTAADAVQESIRLIDIATLDAMLSDDWPVIVKVDVEGHEDVVLPALLGSRHIGRILAIHYEVDTRWTDHARLAGLLHAAGFTDVTRFGTGRHHDVLAARPALKTDVLRHGG